MTPLTPTEESAAMTDSLARWQGKIDAHVETLGREVGELRRDVAAVNSRSDARYDALRVHVDAGFATLTDRVRSDLAAHMLSEENDRHDTTTRMQAITDAVASLRDWRGRMVAVLTFSAWLLGVVMGVVSLWVQQARSLGAP